MGERAAVTNVVRTCSPISLLSFVQLNTLYVETNNSKSAER